MRKTIKSLAVVGMTSILTGCGSLPNAGGTANTAPSNQSSMLENVLGGTTSSTGGSSNSLIGGIIGQLVGGLVTPATIEGTWVYAEPTIQFESENLLAKAGGNLATKSIVEKIQPYYEKVGIAKGAFAITFNSDNTCTYTIKGKTYNGTYAYDKQNNMVEVKSQLGIKLITAYATVSASNLALTFDSTKLLTLFQTFGASSSNATISGLSSLSKSFNGMKTGFLFDKK